MNHRINCNTSHTIILKKSEFITELYRVFSVDEFNTILKEAKKRHPKATHICTAYRIQQFEKSNDDGEPSGTAGLPMLEVLRKQNIVDVCALVIRYYGGIQLGAGGLTRAYSGSVSQALETIKLNPIIDMLDTIIEFPITYTDSILNRLKDIEILSKSFTEQVQLTIRSINDDFLIDLKEITRGQLTVIAQTINEVERKL
ncbi:MAG: YigZ family protein [Erysipelotrichaceae bacterium]|nr:YigZ family protein [Erysipelotrichaceae bacterium]